MTPLPRFTMVASSASLKPDSPGPHQVLQAYRVPSHIATATTIDCPTGPRRWAYMAMTRSQHAHVMFATAWNENSSTPASPLSQNPNTFDRDWLDMVKLTIVRRWDASAARSPNRTERGAARLRFIAAQRPRRAVRAERDRSSASSSWPAGRAPGSPRARPHRRRRPWRGRGRERRSCRR